MVATRSRSTSPADPNRRRGRGAGAASCAGLGAPTEGGRRLAPGVVAARVHIGAPRPGPRHAAHPAFKGEFCSVAALLLPSDSPRQHGSPPLVGSHASPPPSLFPLFPRSRGPSFLDVRRRWRPYIKDRPRTGVKLFRARIGAGGCGRMAGGGGCTTRRCFKSGRLSSPADIAGAFAWLCHPVVASQKTPSTTLLVLVAIPFAAATSFRSDLSITRGFAISS